MRITGIEREIALRLLRAPDAISRADVPSRTRRDRALVLPNTPVALHHEVDRAEPGPEQGLKAVDVINMLRWQRRLSSRDPKLFERYILDLGQEYPHLQPAERAGILIDTLKLRARLDPQLATAWVEGVFRLGGDEVRAALQAYAAGSDGTHEARELAAQRATEMAREDEAKTVLALVPGDGVGDVASRPTC